MLCKQHTTSSNNEEIYSHDIKNLTFQTPFIIRKCQIYILTKPNDRKRDHILILGIKKWSPPQQFNE